MRIYLAIIVALLSSSAFAIDSTNPTLLASAKSTAHNGFKSCCTTTIDLQKIHAVECQGNCGQKGSTVYNQIGCTGNETVVRVSTATRYKQFHRDWHQKVKSIFCAPIKYECSWIRTDQICTG